MLKKAYEFAKKAHEGQFRKVGNEPYIIHPLRVAVRYAFLPNLVSDLMDMNQSELEEILFSQSNSEEIQAAIMHDVIEDSEFTHEDLEKEFGKKIADIVLELTNPSKFVTRKTNRAERKKIDLMHLGEVSDVAKSIKKCDRWDNILDGTKLEPSFRKLYHKETLNLMEVLGVEGEPLTEEIYKVLETY